VYGATAAADDGVDGPVDTAALESVETAVLDPVPFEPVADGAVLPPVTATVVAAPASVDTGAVEGAFVVGATVLLELVLVLLPHDAASRPVAAIAAIRRRLELRMDSP
jgi:hypothetical protein